jgi:uncharacterized membrane protein
VNAAGSVPVALPHAQVGSRARSLGPLVRPGLVRPGLDRLRYAGRVAAALAILDAGVGLHGLWIAKVVVAAWLLTVPGAVVLAALAIPPAVVRRSPAYVLGASVVVMMAAGLVAQGLAGPLGLAALRPPALVLSVNLVVGATALTVRDSRRAVLGLPAPGGRRWLLAFLLPAASVLGAALLGSGHSGVVAMAAGAATVLAGGWLVWSAPRRSRRTVLVVLFCIGLSLTYSYSMLGSHLFGWDISGEYRVLSQTLAAGHWNANTHGNAYSAMLSITVLPAVLSELIGCGGEYVFKAVFPIFAAALLPIVWSLASRFVAARAAVVVALLVAAQASYADTLPALCRQEVAFLFFALVVALLFEDLPWGRRAVLGGAFTAGMIVSHYSTTYTAVALLAIMLLVQLGVRATGRRSAVDPVAVAVFAVAVIGAAVWYFPVTHSATNATRFAKVLVQAGPQLLPDRKTSIFDTWLSGNTGEDLSASGYQTAAAKEHRPDWWISPDPSWQDYPLVADNAPTLSAPIPAAKSLLDAAAVVSSQLVNILGVCGTVLLCVAARKQRDPRLFRIATLGIAVVALLAFTRLSGVTARAYNQERMLVQALIVLAVPLGFVASRPLRRGPRLVRNAGLVVTGGALAVLAATSSGMASIAFGGAPGANLYASGEEFERFSFHPPEVAAARWLGAATPPEAQVVADRYGQLRLIAYTNVSHGLIDDLTPATIDRSAFVYASESNVVDGRARGSVDRGVTDFEFPGAFLRATKGIVYTNSYSEVYR